MDDFFTLALLQQRKLGNPFAEVQAAIAAEIHDLLAEHELAGKPLRYNKEGLDAINDRLRGRTNYRY